MTSPQARALASFERAFGGMPGVAAYAPGRVNLIGEHTDYNDGFVLPCAIGAGTIVVASARADRRVVAVASDYPDARDAFDLDGPIDRTGGWAGYVRGMVVALQQAGFALGGVDMAVAGDIPQGAGLSSSASLEMAVGTALKALFDLETLDPTTLAQMGQRAENDFAGCSCGIMDQLVSARGVAGHALLIDCRSLATRSVAVSPELGLVIIHSGVARALVDGRYNERRRECQAAARHYGVAALRDLDVVWLERNRAGLDPVAFRRARHVVTENARTLAAAQALEASDLPRLSALFAASHASMLDDFEITVPAIDALVALATATLGQQGAVRMTGGGFGGAMIVLCARSDLDGFCNAIGAGYRTPDGKVPTIMTASAAAGAHVLARA